MSMKGPDIS